MSNFWCQVINQNWKAFSFKKIGFYLGSCQIMDSLSLSAPLLSSISFRNIYSRKHFSKMLQSSSLQVVDLCWLYSITNCSFISLFKEWRDSMIFDHREERLSPTSWKSCWQWQGQVKAPHCQWERKGLKLVLSQDFKLIPCFKTPLSR